MLVQQQYQEKVFKKCYELITCLLLGEQNSELLLKNHEFQPTSNSAFPESLIMVVVVDMNIIVMQTVNLTIIVDAVVIYICASQS